MQELVLKRCSKCHNLIKVIENNCSNIKCCDVLMDEVVPNSVDCAQEKHLPQYEVKDDKMVITVNHVMDEDHYIEWLLVKTDTGSYEKYFQPNDVLSMEVPYYSGALIYSYCNKHGLWVTTVK